MHPKGSSHNSRTMEHYRRLGISGAIRKLGLPPDHPEDVGYFTRLTGWELARYHMPSELEVARLGAATQATDQTPEPMLRANQMYVEAFSARARTHAPERRIALRMGSRSDSPRMPTASF